MADIFKASFAGIVPETLLKVGCFKDGAAVMGRNGGI